MSCSRHAWLQLPADIAPLRCLAMLSRGPARAHRRYLVRGLDAACKPLECACFERTTGAWEVERYSHLLF
jgi:hypothetical protein